MSVGRSRAEAAPRLSVVVPVRNRMSVVRQCLHDLLTSVPTDDPEIIVVDDGSGEAVGRLLAEYGDALRVVTRATQGGFAAACNDGAAAARGEHLVFLPPDLLPRTGWLGALRRAAARHPEAAALGNLLLNPDDTVAHAGVAIGQDGLPRPLYAGFPGDHPAASRERPMRAVALGGALVRRAAFEQVGGFDAAFRGAGVYGATDLCLRLSERGHGVLYCPESALHYLDEAARRGRAVDDERDAALFRGRWGGRTTPDDLDYYLEDGLLVVDYDDSYPVRLAVSPRLARLGGLGRDRELDRLLGEKARRVAELTEQADALEAETSRRSDPETAGPASTASASSANASSVTNEDGDVSRTRVSERVMGLEDSASLNDQHPVASGGRPPFGVNVAGHFASEKGVGQAVRSFVQALAAVDVPVVLNNTHDALAANEEARSLGFSPDNPYGVNLILLGAGHVPVFAQERGLAYFERRYNIGHWAWEIASFPEEWLPIFQYFDEVWVASTFIRDNLAKVAPVPIMSVPYAVTAPPPPALQHRLHLGLPNDRFIFTFMFDFASVPERKNPLGLIDAFKRAFGPDDDVLLILKCAHSEQAPAELRAVQDAADRANIRITDCVMSREEIDLLLYLSDCYISLHRAEGFGLTMAEAMSVGKPVIATAYSGNMDFMTARNSFPVRYTPVALERDYGPYKAGSVWADPDLDHAAELMRLVYENRDLARDVGERARRDIRATLDPSVVGQAMKQRLRDVSPASVSPVGVGPASVARSTNRLSALFARARERGTRGRD